MELTLTRGWTEICMWFIIITPQIITANCFNTLLTNRYNDRFLPLMM
jgi:hypothetical protein